jgi:dihydrofolate reductase
MRTSAAYAVAQLKDEPGLGNLVIFGSGALIHALMRRNLIDRFVLAIHPIVLGSGRRLFVEGETCAELRLAQANPSAKGSILTVYESRARS